MTNYIKRAQIVFCLCITIFICNAANALELQSYKVGQANFNVLKTLNNENIVFDAGCRKEPHDQFKKTVINIFKTTKIVFISHCHADHFNLLEYQDLRSSLPPECLFILPPKMHSNSADKLLSILDKEGRWMVDAQSLAQPAFTFNDIYFWIYKMKNINTLSGNSISQIVHVIYANKHILFTGDADARTLDAIEAIKAISYRETYRLGNNNVLQNDEFQDPVFDVQYTQNQNRIWNFLLSNIVVLPHHGSTSSGSDILHQLVMYADHAIICSSMEQMHKLPKLDTLANLAKQAKSKRIWLTGNVVDNTGKVFTNPNIYLSIVISRNGMITPGNFFGAYVEGNQMFIGGGSLSGKSKALTYNHTSGKRPITDIRSVELPNHQEGNKMLAENKKTEINKQQKAENKLEKAENKIEKAENKIEKAKVDIDKANAQKKEAKQEIKAIAKEIKLANNKEPNAIAHTQPNKKIGKGQKTTKK